ncbi:hypothetical protein [Geobacillus thermoleovorans]|uniref:hypothetical protein n=1 Tax=Geobacillus thermoleovorans TaxID=33941 RepID=UPI003D1BEE4D
MEHIRDLFVQVGAIRHDGNGRVAQFLEASQLDGQAEHRQALSRSLRRPDDACPVPSVSCRSKSV